MTYYTSKRECHIYCDILLKPYKLRKSLYKTYPVFGTVNNEYTLANYVFIAHEFMSGVNS